MKQNYNATVFYQRNMLLKKNGYASYEEYLEGFFWKKTKDLLSKKKEFKNCTCCGSDQMTHLHHESYNTWMFRRDKVHRILIPVCASCHLTIHDISRKSNISFVKARKRLCKKIARKRFLRDN